METRLATYQARPDVWCLIDSRTATFSNVASDSEAVADAWRAVHSAACTDVSHTVHDMSVVLLRQVCLAVVLIHAWLDEHDMLESAWVERSTDATDEIVKDVCVKKVHALSKNDNRKARSLPTILL